MPRTPKARQTRLTAPTSFVNENSDDDSFGFTEASRSRRQEDDNIENSDDDAKTMAKFLQEYKKQRAKKNSARSVAFDGQKKALYASARKTAEEISRDGIAYLEEMKAQVMNMKQQEISYEKYTNGLSQLGEDSNEALIKLLAIYPLVKEDLFVRRRQALEIAGKMLKSNPSKKEQALQQFLRNAHGQVEKSRQNEKLATDASKLIKHYKDLLRG
ncbi:uncharacterized protein BT62DRAFT_992994 [Guyanagaster necrorhizus]|uniref:Uncharacterized protein n=1 Tax=Guyanagaster necrorhizus TaxID=856835 RepID=A0A9P8AU56_9AGAR|nr:uncharacterized protein BT62DRAFT_992994 [Guyanagaster necrorhizus MCA 3950]KAG7448128.1 hypothetical protein BT62DRAFT_992994 [Guyanagaster necrorhizus MCA 3950]